MRPCLIVVWRWRAKFAVLPPVAKPTGSQQPAGAWLLALLLVARSREAVKRAPSTQGEAAAAAGASGAATQAGAAAAAVVAVAAAAAIAAEV
eukprot:10140340-Heterocapsa_arctica.AAC.1